jgi:hypothetical protein
MLLIDEWKRNRFARLIGCLVTLAVTLTAAAGTTHADSIGFTSPGGLSAGDPNRPVNLGMLFTANTNFSVTSLGIYVEPGLSAPEEVGLYDNATRTLLASTTVLLTDPETDGYLFHAITPVALTAGDEYMVVANVGDNSWAKGPAPIQNPDVSFVQSAYLYESSLAFPTANNGFSYYGPNFTIGAAGVPEPSSLVLGGIAGAALTLAALWRRRLATAPRLRL